MAPPSYRRHRFPPEVIQHAIWVYLRFILSYRDVEWTDCDFGRKWREDRRREDRGFHGVTKSSPPCLWRYLFMPINIKYDKAVGCLTKASRC